MSKKNKKKNNNKNNNKKKQGNSIQKKINDIKAEDKVEAAKGEATEIEESNAEAKIIENETPTETITDVEAPAMKKESKLSPGMRELLSWLKVIVIAFLISIFVTQVVLINATVPSTSMESLISPGDRLFGFRLQYKMFGDPQRQDVIIFKYPVDEEEKFIKRIIGLPGETVYIRDGKVYIDDATEPLDEPYLPEEWEAFNDGFVFHVPEDSYFVMGDNRNVSNDARFWADEAYRSGLADSESEAMEYSFVKRDAILGKAIVKYWPFSDIRSLVYDGN